MIRIGDALYGSIVSDLYGTRYVICAMQMPLTYATACVDEHGQFYLMDDNTLVNDIITKTTPPTTMLKRVKGDMGWCEVGAIVSIGKKLLIATDRVIDELQLFVCLNGKGECVLSSKYKRVNTKFWGAIHA